MRRRRPLVLAHAASPFNCSRSSWRPVFAIRSQLWSKHVTAGAARGASSVLRPLTAGVELGPRVLVRVLGHVRAALKLAGHLLDARDLFEVQILLQLFSNDFDGLHEQVEGDAQQDSALGAAAGQLRPALLQVAVARQQADLALRRQAAVHVRQQRADLVDRDRALPLQHLGACIALADGFVRGSVQRARRIFAADHERLCSPQLQVPQT